MKNQKGIALLPVIILLVAIIGGGLYFSGRGDNVMMEKESDAMMQEEVMMEKPAEAMMNDEVPYAGSPDGAIDPFLNESGTVLMFTSSGYQRALASDKLIVLYFYADWCPVCQAEFPKMISAFNKLTSDGAVGFRVNYKDDFTDEDEIALAKQFGIAYQHTKVFLKNGKQVLKSPESWDETRYVNEIEKAL